MGKPKEHSDLRNAQNNIHVPTLRGESGLRTSVAEPIIVASSTQRVCSGSESHRFRRPLTLAMAACPWVIVGLAVVQHSLARSHKQRLSAR